MFGPRHRRLLILLACLALFLTGFNPGLGNAYVVAASDSRGDQSLIAKTETYMQLLPRAQALGTLRVIVRLEMPFVPESLQSSAYAILAQRYRIQQVQSAVVASLNVSHAVAARFYEHVPFLVLEVDGSGLWELIHNPLVATIQEDVPVPVTLL